MAQPGGPSSAPLTTLRGYEPSPGLSSPRNVHSSSSVRPLQPAGKTHANLVVSQAWPPGQCEGVRKVALGYQSRVGNTIVCWAF